MSHLKSDAPLEDFSSPTVSTNSISTDEALVSTSQPLAAVGEDSLEDSNSTLSSPSTSSADSYFVSTAGIEHQLADISSASPTSSEPEESEHSNCCTQSDPHTVSPSEEGSDEFEVDKELLLSSSSDELETDADDSEDISETVLKVFGKTPPETYFSFEQKARAHEIISHSLNIRGSRQEREKKVRDTQDNTVRNTRQRRVFINRGVFILRRVDYHLHKMLVFGSHHHKECCIIFLILACGLASIKSSPPKVRVTSAPNPFFEDKDASYFLQDNYMGEYVDLANKQIPYYPSFLFYYAPWDSESVAARDVFLSVAKHFFFTKNGRVKFVAVNCWWPTGQCRKNYKNLSHYPIFVAHVGRSTGIIYNGPLRLEPMVKFINTLLKPATRLDTEEDLWRFRAQHDVIMLGYFNFTQKGSSDAYETYLQMALRTLEADPFNQVGFGVFLRPELAEKFFLTSSNAISLVLFNEIHTAKWHGGYHNQGLKGPVSQVADWIIERTKSVPLTWVYALRNGFANRPVALGPHDFASMISSGPVLLLVTRRYFPSGHSPFYMQVKEVALDYFNCNRSGNVTKLRRTAHKVNAEWSSLWSSVVQICQRKGSFQCQQIMANIKHWETKRLLFKREPLLHYENVSSAINFTGLSCDSERNFKFLAIDPLDVPFFVDLGLSGLENLAGKSDQSIDPMAFIIDSQNDIMVPLSSFNISEIALAIYNYTTASETGNTEMLSSRLFVNHDRNRQENFKRSSNNLFQTWGSSDLIKYVTSDSELNNSNSVLLMYTASFCGFCTIATTHFVSLARFLADNYGDGRLNITLAKIDMFKNTLPLELSPKQLPTVIYLPSSNRSDIKMYPENQEVTTIGLLRFILSELEPARRVEASLMSPSCGPNGGKCVAQQNQSGGLECHTVTSSLWSRSNATTEERFSCIKSGRTSVSNQIDFLLQKLRNGDQVDFERALGPLNQVTPQTWNGRLLDRLRTMALTLDVS